MSSPTFEEYLTNRTSRDANDIPSVVLIAVDKDGKDIIHHSSGRQSWSSTSTTTISPSSTMWFASCAKLLTTICALQCISRGQITLDSPISSIVPELASPEIIIQNRGEVGETEPRFCCEPAENSEITLRQLLTHSSGVGYDNDLLLKAWRRDRGEEPQLLSGKVKPLLGMPLLFEPGQGWTYGASLDVVGTIVARMNNITLEEYMAEHIFSPLGLKGSTFRLNGHPDVKARLVDLSKRKEDGRLERADCPWPENAEEDSGGGGLWSSPEDYVTILHDLIRDEPRLLEGEMVETMFTPQIAPGTPAHTSLVEQPEVWQLMTGPIDGSEGGKGAEGVSYGLGGLLMTQNSPDVPAGTMLWGGAPNIKWFVNRRLGVAGLYAGYMVPRGDPVNVELAAECTREIWKRSAKFEPSVK